jgi:hypothetical protein
MSDCWMCRDFGKEEKHADHLDAYYVDVRDNETGEVTGGFWATTK